MAGTSLRDIMAVTNLAKGCLYSHFKSKEELCLSAFNFLTENIKNELSQRLEKHKRAIDKLEAFLLYYQEIIRRGSNGGCPVINFGSEADDTNQSIRKRVLEVMEENQSYLEKLIHQGIAEGDLEPTISVSQQALKLYLMLEGAIILGKNSSNRDYLDQIVYFIHEAIKQISIIKKEIKAMKNTLFTPLELGNISISNRLIMAPLTRRRANKNMEPTDMMVDYYSQRSGAGLIISEASQICLLGQGYPLTPGIYTKKQIQGWEKITKAVHQHNGKIVIQLWHVGRVSHSSLHPKEGLPVAPSAIKPEGMTLNADSQQVPFETPRSMETGEIKTLIQTYRQAAINAKEAGFDGIELHSANGYLLNEFLHEKTNHRTDDYGGSVENRCRVVLETLEELIDVWGPGRIGIRLSPFTNSFDIYDKNSYATYVYLLKKLSDLHLAYVHLIRFRAEEHTEEGMAEKQQQLWKNYQGNLIAADGFSPETAQEYVESGLADAIAFGRLYIANPDLATRIQQKASLNPYDRSTFYDGGSKGYIDYPFLNK